MPKYIVRPNSVKFDSNNPYYTSNNINNIWDGSLDTYGEIIRDITSTTTMVSYYYINGFDFSQLPIDRAITGGTIYVTMQSTTSSNYSLDIYSDGVEKVNLGFTSTSKKTFTKELSTEFINKLKNSTVSTNGIVTRISAKSTTYPETELVHKIYDVYLEIDIAGDFKTITTSLTGDGSIEPEGTFTNVYREGEEFSLKIIPTSNDDIVTATKNGVDITSSLVETLPSISEKNLGTYTFVSGTMQSSASTYFSALAGRGYDYTPTTTTNYYSGQSSIISIFTYDMSITDIPAGKPIINCYLKVTGKCESTSNANEYMCVSLVDNDDNEIIPEFNFKTSGSTSLSTQTLNATTMPTASQLANCKLKCRLGYYGGNIVGATLFVEYGGEFVHQYTYSYIINEDATIAVTIQSPIKVVKLYPSIFTRSSTSYLTLVDEANITDNDDTTYGTLNHTRSQTTAYYLYCGGFDFSSIPEGYVVDSVVAKVIANVTSASTSQKPTFYNNTTSASSLGTFSTNIGTSKTTSTVNMTVANFNTFKGYGNNARIRLYLNRSNKNTASNMKIYEVYLEVTCVMVSATKNIKIGSSQVDKLYIGTSEVDKIYIGTTVVYEK